MGSIDGLVHAQMSTTPKPKPKPKPKKKKAPVDNNQSDLFSDF